MMSYKDVEFQKMKPAEPDAAMPDQDYESTLE